MVHTINNNLYMPKHFAVVGSHCTGKTTVFNEIRKEYKQQFVFFPEYIEELKTLGVQFNEDGTDVTQIIATNLCLKQFYQEKTFSDRCLLDVLVYSIYLNKQNKLSDRTMQIIQNFWDKYKYFYTSLFYIPIEIEVENNGVRSTDETFRNEIDLIFQRIISEEDIPIYVISGNLQQRVTKIKDVLNGI